jgi:hypothetical protein
VLTLYIVTHLYAVALEFAEYPISLHYSCCMRGGDVLLEYVLYRGTGSGTTGYMPAGLCIHMFAGMTSRVFMNLQKVSFLAECMGSWRCRVGEVK